MSLSDILSPGIYAGVGAVSTKLLLGGAGGDKIYIKPFGVYLTDLDPLIAGALVGVGVWGATKLASKYLLPGVNSNEGAITRESKILNAGLGAAGALGVWALVNSESVSNLGVLPILAGGAASSMLADYAAEAVTNERTY